MNQPFGTEFLEEARGAATAAAGIPKWYYTLDYLLVFGYSGREKAQ